jgi:DNA-binding HxlR family transcriptional regulator
MENCPRTFGLRILSRKWSYYTLRALRTPKTFSDLQRELKHVTNHIMSRELKLLQKEKVVTLQESKYFLTPAGKTLLEAVEPLYMWGNTHANLRECPSGQNCSSCSRYDDIVKPKLEY